MELLRELVIPLYIRRVKMSDKRRAKYYELGKKTKLPKKYIGKKYQWKAHKVGTASKVFLTDVTTGLRVIKNSKSVGTASYKVINGQYIYNQTLVKEARNKVLPIRIEVELHYPMLADNKKPWDIDNHFYIYQKAFQDVLVGHRDKEGNARCQIIIPDDHNLFVSKPPSPLHIPVSTFEERQMIFKIYKESDPRITENPERKELFNKLIKEYDEQYRPIGR